MQLKERLETLRHDRGYTLRELRARIEAATGVDLSIAYLSALERVERAPSIETLARIAAGYEITVQDLLEPVELVSPSATRSYSPSFQAFAQKRELSDMDQEELWRVVYRGSRPDTIDDWELLYVTLNSINRRRGRTR